MPIRFPPRDFSAATGFGRNPLDRRSESRGEAAVLAAAYGDPAARFHLFTRERALITAEADTAAAALCDAATGGFTRAAAEAIGHGDDPLVLLGWDAAGRPHLAAFTDEAHAETPPPGTIAADLRGLAVQGPALEGGFGLEAQARSLLNWHASHRFCSACGAPSRMAIGGYRRDCPACGTSHFPRTDPVVIMLAIDGEACLLGRQPRFPPGRYSCLAGFVEPGETVEDAVRREIFEEAGIRTGAVAYHASQPWPFPMSLMIGCYAEATSTAITMDTAELEDCRWFGRDEVARMRAGTHPDGLTMPAGGAIATHIVAHWLEG